MKCKTLLLLLLAQLILTQTILAADTLYDDRFRKWQTQAEQGDPRAQYSLGNAYLKGNEVKKDINKAIEWFEKAAKQKHAKSEYKLGKLYYEGNSVRRNYSTSYRWIKKSAEHGHHPAQFLLGKMYALGHGTDKDLDIALDWLEKARADQFLPVAEEISRVRKMIAARQKEDSAAQVAHIESTVAPSPGPSAAPAPQPAPIAVKMSTKTLKTAPDNGGQTYDIPKLLLEGGWRDASGNAAIHLPSDINRCEKTPGYNIACSSSRQTRGNRFARILYRVTSTFKDFDPKGRFVAEYRINNIKVERLNASGTPGENDVPSTGMQPKDIAKCRFVDNSNITCVTDRMQRLAFSR